MNPKRKAVVDRISGFEEAIAKAREYLESGAHAQWSGFRPLFASKVRDGRELPPHKDWVKNVFIPRRERALRHAEKVLAKLEKARRSERRDKSRPI
ncbi:MAG TPA: hypothetical protein VH370_19080 [Humisphaera sp.]|jgi:hypothetical protein|nr:hypothetical protein [Humisphaera sp.]